MKFNSNIFKAVLLIFIICSSHILVTSSTINLAVRRNTRLNSKRNKDKNQGIISTVSDKLEKAKDKIKSCFKFKGKFTFAKLWKAAVLASEKFDGVVVHTALFINSPASYIIRSMRQLFKSNKIGKFVKRVKGFIKGKTDGHPEDQTKLEAPAVGAAPPADKKEETTESEEIITEKEKETMEKELEKQPDADLANKVKEGVKTQAPGPIFRVLEHILMTSVNDIARGFVKELVNSFTPIGLLTGESTVFPDDVAENLLNNNVDVLKTLENNMKNMTSLSVNTCIDNNEQIREQVKNGLKGIIQFFKDRFDDYKELFKMMRKSNEPKNSPGYKKASVKSVLKKCKNIGEGLMAILKGIFSTFKELFSCFAKAYVANANNFGEILLGVAGQIVDGLVKSIPFWSQITGVFNMFLHIYRKVRLFIKLSDIIFNIIHKFTQKKEKDSDDDIPDEATKKKFTLITDENANKVIAGYTQLNTAFLKKHVVGIGSMIGQSIISAINGIMALINADGLSEIIKGITFAITGIVSKLVEWKKTSKGDSALTVNAADPLNPEILKRVLNPDMTDKLKKAEDNLHTPERDSEIPEGLEDQVDDMLADCEE